MQIPSYKSISRWLTRVGLYKLNSLKEQGNDWALIIDNSIQVGHHKCLVILGTRLSKLKLKSLTFADVEVLLIEIHENPTQNIICQAMEKAQAKVGQVVMVCADDGSDLRGGVKLFCQKYGAGRVYDTIHKIGTFLKRILETNPKWQAFTKATTEAKKRMQQTSAAHLMPPNQRTKSRFLNIDVLTQWSVDALSILTGKESSDKKLLEQYCGWLLDYKELVEQLRQLDLINKHVRQHIREYGLSSRTGEHVEALLEKAMKSASFNFSACQYAGKIIDFFQEHSKIVPQNQVWIGSSEIIESLFGKFKALEQNQHKGGFTSLVLGMAACTGALDDSVIKKAILETKTKDVEAWTKAQIGTTFLSKRRTSLGGWRKKKTSTKKMTKPILIENVQESTGTNIGKVAGF